MGFDMPVRTYPELIYDTCPVCREPSLTGHHRIYTTIIDDCNICKNTIEYIKFSTSVTNDRLSTGRSKIALIQ